MSLATEFRDFILRGNVVDLAVGVVIGAAFTGVVTAFTKDLLTPLIGIPGKVNFAEWAFDVNGSKFMIGDFINQIISFLIIAIVVFIFVVKPVNYLMARFKPQAPTEETTRECPFCLSKVPIKASRCAFCTSELPAAGAAPAATA
jgi:large conductance mechanosensitive channel